MNINNITRHFKLPALAAFIFSTALLVGCGGDDDKSAPSENPSVSSSSISKSSSLSSSFKSSSLKSSSSKKSSASSSKKSSSSSVSSAAATFKTVNISAPSLAGNLVADATTRDISVYLPKAYFTSNSPLPVVYYLPGFGDTTMLDITFPNDLNTAFNTLHPTIVVIVSGVNSFYGSFFVDSAVTGNWSDFVLKDVVDYIDANYRTIPNNKSRGIAGHSMGGFGALDIAMRHPEVFGSVFAISPGLAAGNRGGVADTQMFDNDAHIKAFITAIAPIKNLAPAAALDALKQTNEYFDIAYGVAFAPLPNPPYFEYPYTLVNNVLVRDDAIWAKWDAGFGAIHSEVEQFNSNLSSLNGIGLDCGTNDEYQWIVRGCADYDAELTAAGIQHKYTTHTGKHQDQIRKRILEVMLPFFSERLETE